MATPETLKEKLQGLIDLSNQTTGKDDSDLTSAINRLRDGYFDKTNIYDGEYEVIEEQ